jgi:glycosidase
MQWDDSENGGSTAGTPWLKVNLNDVSINIAAQQKDADTVLNYDKKLPALRKRKE